MSEESNVCKICGGYKRLDPGMIKQTGDARLLGPIKLCPGHPEPAQKHNGRLDEKGDYTVEIWNEKGHTTVDIDENISSWLKDDPDHVELTPKQALSLLDWLTQKKPELERLAKEQEG